MDPYQMAGYGGSMTAGAARGAQPQREPLYQRVNAASAKPSQPASTGYVNVGHDGKFQGMDREAWRDAWMGLGKIKASDADAWLRAHGAVNTNSGKGDRWMTPYGEHLDLQIARSAANAGRNGGMITAGWGSTGGAPRGFTPPGLNANPAGPMATMPSGPVSVQPSNVSVWQRLLAEENARANTPDVTALRNVMGRDPGQSLY